MRFDYRLIMVAALTFFGNAYVQYLVYGSVNWTNAVLLGLALTAIVPFFFRKKR